MNRHHVDFKRRREEQAAMEEVNDAVRGGSICSLCHEELNPPGGTTVPTWDGATLFRVCPQCKAAVEQHRRQPLG